MTIQFNPTKKSTMLACLFPESHEERSEMVKALKRMGFVKSGKIHESTRMVATIGGIKHTAIIENIED